MVKSHIKLWIILLFLAALIVPALMTPDEARSRLQAELDSSVAIFGAQKVTALTESAGSVYRAVVGTLGLDRLVHSGYVDRNAADTKIVANKLNREMSTFTNGYLETLLIQVYGVFYRGALMLHWFLYIGIFLFAAAYDGFSQRKIKQDTIQLLSPLKFSIAVNTLVAILFIPLAYLLLPANVTPWFMPTWALIAAIPLSKSISNAVRTS